MLDVNILGLSSNILEFIRTLAISYCNTLNILECYVMKIRLLGYGYVLHDTPDWYENIEYKALRKFVYKAVITAAFLVYGAVALHSEFKFRVC